VLDDVVGLDEPDDRRGDLCYGDDAGRRLPPVVAPVQAVVIAVSDEPRTLEAVAAAEQALRSRRIRSRVDRRTDLGLGQRITDWELKGVPVRIEIGPRDLAGQAATVVRRDSGERESMAQARLPGAVAELQRDVQATLAREAMEHTRRHLHDVGTVEEACDAARTVSPGLGGRSRRRRRAAAERAGDLCAVPPDGGRSGAGAA
jgi:prolyl-tRNA synthetase